MCCFYPLYLCHQYPHEQDSAFTSEGLGRSQGISRNGCRWAVPAPTASDCATPLVPATCPLQAVCSALAAQSHPDGFHATAQTPRVSFVSLHIWWQGKGGCMGRCGKGRVGVEPRPDKKELHTVFDFANISCRRRSHSKNVSQNDTWANGPEE